MIFTKKFDFVPKDKNKVNEKLKNISVDTEFTKNLIYIKRVIGGVIINSTVKCKVEYEEDYTKISVYPTILSIINTLLLIGFFIFAFEGEFSLFHFGLFILPGVYYILDNYFNYRYCVEKIADVFAKFDSKFEQKNKERKLIITLLSFNIIVLAIEYQFDVASELDIVRFCELYAFPLIAIYCSLKYEKNLKLKILFILINLVCIGGMLINWFR